MTVWSGQVSVGGGPPGPGTVELTEDALGIVPEVGPPVHLALVDIEDVHDDDYTLRLLDHTGTRYELSMFGRPYGQIVADLRKARESRLERDLLLRGVNLQDSFPGKLFGQGGSFPVEIRLYEDLLVVVPERHTMFGIPFSFVDRVEWEPELYQTRVVTDEGIALTFGHLGRRSEEFRDELRRCLDALARRTARILGTLLPGLDPATLSGLAALMRDGRAVQHRAVDAIDPAIWPRLEDAAVGTEQLRETYERLKSMTPAGWTAFGVKAVLTESQGGEPAEDRDSRSDLWYFCPLDRDGRPVNAVAQEVTSEGGHATYLFRLMETERFEALSGDALADEVGMSIARLNRALLQLNFRREPIYLPEDQLDTGEHARYRVALRKLDYLRSARAAFLGRAVHNASWEQQVAEAIDRA